MERRLTLRFQLAFPCFVCSDVPIESRMQELLTTSNISCDGAYVRTVHPYPLATYLHCDLLSQSVGAKAKGLPGALITTVGEVVRVEEDGMALRFIGPCQIRRLACGADIARQRVRWIEKVAAKAHVLSPPPSIGSHL